MTRFYAFCMLLILAYSSAFANENTSSSAQDIDFDSVISAIENARRTYEELFAAVPPSDTSGFDDYAGNVDNFSDITAPVNPIEGVEGSGNEGSGGYGWTVSI